MELKRVTSSNLEAIGYDGTNQSLIVQFKNGTYYKYENVPYAIYQKLLSVRSVGKYFDVVIRNKFAYSKINILGET